MHSQTLLAGSQISTATRPDATNGSRDSTHGIASMEVNSEFVDRFDLPGLGLRLDACPKVSIDQELMAVLLS